MTKKNEEKLAEVRENDEFLDQLPFEQDEVPEGWPRLLAISKMWRSDRGLSVEKEDERFTEAYIQILRACKKAYGLEKNDSDYPLITKNVPLTPRAIIHFELFKRIYEGK
jgi:hypothetical protein